MNYMDAVEILSVITTDAAQRLTSTEMDDAIAEAIQALEVMPEYKRLKERDRAMTVTDVHLDEYYCPACGAENGCCDGKVEDNFCPVCGQRLGWSGEEEE